MILQISNIATYIKCHHGIMIEILAITTLMATALYTSIFSGPSHTSFHNTIKENWL